MIDKVKLNLDPLKFHWKKSSVFWWFIEINIECVEMSANKDSICLDKIECRIENFKLAPTEIIKLECHVTLFRT